MATTQIATTVTVQITLSLDEARWLKAVLQNPLSDDTPDTEPAPDRHHRKAIWEALHHLLETRD